MQFCGLKFQSSPFVSQESCFTVSSDNIFDSSGKGKKTRGQRNGLRPGILSLEESPFETKKAATRQTRKMPVGDKKHESIERCRKTKDPSYNFSEFDSFDLVVETASEGKKPTNFFRGKYSLDKTPASVHEDFEKDSFLIPRNPKMNLEGENAFSVGNTFDSLPNSPAIDGNHNAQLEDSIFMHTSSPIVGSESGCEADRSGSSSCHERCRLSEAGDLVPLADISAISDVPSSVVPSQPSALQSIDEDNVSHFRPTFACRGSPSASGRGSSNRERSRASIQESTSDDVAYTKALEDIAQLSEQLSRMNTADQSPEGRPNSPHCCHKLGDVQNSQTPKQHFTKHSVKSTRKGTRTCHDDAPKTEVQFTPKQQPSVFRRIVTRSVAKARAEVSYYDASQ